jgi:hypothetical protein
VPVVADDALTRVAQRALAKRGAVLLDYELHPLQYDTYLPGRFVVQVITTHAGACGRS